MQCSYLSKQLFLILLLLQFFVAVETKLYDALFAGYIETNVAVETFYYYLSKQLFLILPNQQFYMTYILKSGRSKNEELRVLKGHTKNKR